MNNESRNPKLYFENNYISPVPGFVANNENLVNAFHYDIRSNSPICQAESHRFLYYEHSSNPSVIYFWLDFTGYNFHDATDFSADFAMRFSVFTPVRCTMHRDGNHYYVRVAVSSEECFPLHELLRNDIWPTFIEYWLEDIAEEYY